MVRSARALAPTLPGCEVRTSTTRSRARTAAAAAVLSFAAASLAACAGA
ncbi:MAG: hypothetical protein RML12_08860 [Xanthomonadales bacterium]|nr:hypothetical protein [Xanthomonadales bacterium]